MRAEARTWDDRNRAWAAKLALRPESAEERAQLESFAAFVGIELNGSRLEIVWSWERVDRNRKKLGERRTVRQRESDRRGGAAVEGMSNARDHEPR